MEHRDWKNSLQETAGRHASRRGAFSAGLTALAVAAVLVFNLLAAQLPEQWAQIDLTGSGIYNISETSQDYLAGLEDDVVIHVLTDKDTLDTRIVRFLDIYADLSDHLTLEYTDPTVYPSALSQYGVGADTIVVTCEATGRQESFDISDIIGYDMMSYYYYGTYTETDFDGESLLTSAIDSVLTGVTRMVYETTGHNETAVPISVKERFTRLHMSVERVNLLTDGGIPEDCSLLILNEPDQDLADDELDMILNYLAEGGQVIYNMAGELVDLPNFNALCAAYGMQVADGMIADTSQGYQNNPYLFFAQADTSVDAASSLTSDSMVLFYASRGFTLADPTRDTITVQPFLTTTENGYAVLAVNCAGEHHFTLSGSVPVHRCAANLQVRADVGRVALQKGPFVYCFEQQDNGENLAALRMAPDAAVEEKAPAEGLPGNLPELDVSGCRIVSTGVDDAELYADCVLRTEPCTLHAVPYGLWGNRTPGEMRVWVDTTIS
ncbi:MAG: hypothetical protein EGR51_00345 [Oscillibacter sp.]|nr:hypothetical protein [Oscillibacter sp.]